MRNYNSCYKRITFNVICIFVLIFSSILFFDSPQIFACAENSEIENEINQNIDNILDGIDTDEFDDYLDEDFGFDYFSVNSFKELVTKILAGEYFLEYDSLLEYFSSNFLESFKSVFSFILTIFAIIILYEIFANLCVDKYQDLKKSVRFIFSLVIALSLLVLVKNVSNTLTENINKIFSFSNILFPVLLTLVLSSGATGTFSVYSSLSVFVLNSGLYIFMYLLLPLAIAILVLSLFGGISSHKFSKLINLLKYIFKLIVTILFGIFGLFSIVNVISSGMKDGLSLKITKYAIKNYIPVLGGYISEGFDFVKTCSVLVKNAFGVCGIFALLLIVIKPLLLHLVYICSFKILSVLTSFIGNDSYSNVFEDISKGFSFLLAVLIGVFLIMFVFIFLIIISVSVTPWFIRSLW